MGTIKTFEELELWQRARAFCLSIYKLTSKGSFSKDFALRDQINRSAGSIMDNIAEGFERGGRNEFINFLSYSKASAAEARSQIYRALDREHISQEEFQSSKVESEELGKMIGGFMKYLKQSSIQGNKFNGRE